VLTSVASILTPSAIALSGLADVSPIRGVISAIYPLIIYALLGASKNLSVGPEAATSVLTGVVITKYMNEFGDGVISRDEVACAIGFLAGCIALGLSAIQAGFMDNILSGFLLVGFVTAVSCLLMAEQLGALLGLTIPELEGDSSTFEKLVHIFTEGHSLHFPTFFFALGSVLFLVSFRFTKPYFKNKSKYFEKIPEILILVVVSIIMSIVFDFKKIGIPILGDIETSFKITPKLPSFSLKSIGALFPDIFTIVIVGYVESQVVTRQGKAEGTI
jgi:sulfate permease, SulP family